MNVGGADFECAVSVCNVKPFGSNRVQSDDVCEKHGFNSCIVIVSPEGKFLSKWDVYPKIPKWTDDLSEAIVYHDWKSCHEMCFDWHRDVLGNCTYRHVEGPRPELPAYLTRNAELTSRIEGYGREVA